MSSVTNIPSGFKQALSKFDSPFDQETILDDDKELWLIRIPDNLNEEDLAHIKMKVPNDKASKKALGKLEKGNDKYALYKVPIGVNLKSQSDGEELDDNVDLGISGHEMVSFDCLVPSRENNGRLVFAPKAFNQYLILNQVVDIPDSTALAQSILETPVYKRDQPEGLEMRFKPYGYYSAQVTKDADIEIKDTKVIEDQVAKKRKHEGDQEDEKKIKKEKKDKKKDKKEKKSKK